MAPQSLDLGLSLGLGVAAFQPSFCHPAGNAAAVAEREASPTTADERERRCSPASSPASSGSGSGKRAAAERSASAGSGSGDDDDDGGARKKLRLSKDQAAVLEDCFKTHHTLTPKQKAALASRLGLRSRQVEVWFQNRRARTKLKQTEVDCEYLKRWCEQLAEENRRLGKEVTELRALSAAPAPAAPLTALTMCLSCMRVASSSSSPSPNAHAHAAADGSGENTASPAALPAQRQFLCGFRDAGAAAAAVYGIGTSAALAKAVRAAR